MSVVKCNRFLRGVKLAHQKDTSEDETLEFPVPERIVVPMSQHIGVPCEPVVQVGDSVLVGQKVGDSTAPFSAPIHSGVSGRVEAVTDFHMLSGKTCRALVIQSDGLQTPDPAIHPPVIQNRQDFIDAVHASGLVGLGGAGFPTWLKLNYKDLDRVNTLVINAAECEPYITSDYREIMENTEDVVNGIKAVSKYLSIPNVYIGVEVNKPQAIKLFNEAFQNSDKVKIVKLPTIYPQGAEKSIAYSTAGIVVEQGKLPADCGVLVLNVSSAGMIGKYLKDGMPLISRRVTVAGGAVGDPHNVRVPIGTPVQELLSFCKADTENCSEVLYGGPMMGSSIPELSAPILKNNNGVTVLSKEETTVPETTACIRCGKCISVCPMKLMPARLEKAYDMRDAAALRKLCLNLCINCGCCSYICPAKRNLAQKNQLAKLWLKEQPKEEGDK